MYPSETIYQWRDLFMHHLPRLSAPQATELASWCLGIVLAKSSTLTQVFVALAAWSKVGIQTVRQRLRDFYLPADIKRGKKRAELVVEDSFGDLFTWVLSLLPGKKVALALDASLIEDRFAALCISVLVGGCAIPVAWKLLPANQKGEWKSHWLTLLSRLAGSASAGREVYVLMDRGLSADWLFQAICRNGWRPLMRINADGCFKPEGDTWRPLQGMIAKDGQAICVPGLCWKQSRLPCVLLCFWGQAAREPWLLLTDRVREPTEASWYGLRMWIEHQFKVVKSQGLQCEKSRMADPLRMERLWLAYAVSLLMHLSHGSAAEQTGQFDGRAGDRRRKDGTKARLVSLWLKGRAVLMAAVSGHVRMRCPHFEDDIWPSYTAINNTS